MIRLSKRISFIFVFIIIALSITEKAFAVGSGGLTNQVAGARALGMGNAFAAEASDISAITFNPAGLTQLKATEFSLGTTMQLSSTEYTSSSGVNDKTKDQTFYTPNLYFYTPTKNMGIGLGVTSPFGLGIEWSDISPLRFVSTKSKLDVVNINPTLSFEINSVFSVGIGADYFNSPNVEIGNKLDVALLNTNLGAPDTASEGDAVLKGEGDGWGYNLGLLYLPSPKHKIGLAYRSEVKVNYEGEVRLSGLSGASETVFGGSNYRNNISTEITYPQIITLGYAYKIKDNWTIEGDIEWTGWSSYKEQNIRYSETDPTRSAILNTGNPTPKEWNDVFSYAIGTEYILENDISLRAGYFFFNSPVPDKTFDPSLPDSDVHGIALGAGYPFRSFIIDLAYQGLFPEKRNVNNDVGASAGTTVDGEYKTVLHYVGLNITYRF